MNPEIGPKLQAGLDKAGVGSAERHLFLCIGPDCCTPAEGDQTWEYLKARVKETGLRAMRTKAGCFRVCVEGPILAIYPDGCWYSRVTPERLERIIQQHLMGSQPVEEWVIARNALSCPSAGTSAAPDSPPPLESR